MRFWSIHSTVVMAGLDPAIHAVVLPLNSEHVFRGSNSVRLRAVDGQVKPGHDDVGMAPSWA